MKHVIVGSGPAGVIAAENLRKLSATDSITIVGSEPCAPYSRMALPYFLAGDVEEDGTYLRHGENHYDELAIDLRVGRVAEVSTNGNVALDNGEELDFDRLLIATGASAIRPPIPGMDLPNIHNCWTLDDAHEFLESAAAGELA